MSLEQEIRIKMENLPKEYTPENRHLFPKEIQEVFDFLEANKGTIFFPEKYYSAQKSMLQVNVKKIWDEQPDLPLPQVISQIMAKLPKFLPPENLIEVTRIITDEWTSHVSKMAA